MEIFSPSLPQAVAAARLALTEALVLKVGQTLEALVVGKTADGATQLKIGDQTVTAKLAQNFAIGTMLQLQVKSGGAAAHLAILAVRAPATGPVARAGVATAPAARGVLTPVPGVTRQAVSEPVATQPRPVVPPPAMETNESTPKVAISSSQLESKPVVVEHTAAPPTGAPARPAVSEETVPVLVSSPTAEPQEPVVTARSGQSIQSVPPQLAATSASPMMPEVPAPTQPAPTVAPPVVTAAPEQPVGMDSRPLPTAPVPTQITTTPAAQPAPQVAAAPLVVAASAAPPEELPQPAAQALPPNADSRPAVAAQEVAVPIEPEGEALNPLLLAQAAARPQASLAELPRVVLLQTPPPPPAAPPATGLPQMPQTPQGAVAHMVPEALARQDSIGPLLRTLAAVLQAPVALPEPIVRAALGLLAQRVAVPDGKVSANDLEQAVARSGVGLEASLARGQPAPNDAKAGVTALREMVAKWVGDGKPAAPPHDPAPPPLKGLPIRAPLAADLPALPDSGREIGKLLHTQADASVSRIKLMQVASLPDGGDPKLPAPPTLRVEVPFLIGHELVMAQIQIAREGRRREAEQRRGWTMRFALNFSATGEVGAEVGLLGKAVNVSLWAAEPKTAEVLAEGLPELQRALEAIGLDSGPIRMRHGPPEAERPTSGHLLDSVS